MPKDNAQPTAIGEVKPGKYSDGHPLDDVHYLESKIILHGERFTSVQSFRDFSKLVRHAAEKCEVDFRTQEVAGLRPQIREVLFLDTADFRLYNHAFILRRRLTYEDGFPVGDPEIVFKFRHPDLQAAAACDVRPNVTGAFRIKFKAEALPLKDRLGGIRVLYSHNAEFSLGVVDPDRRTSMSTLLAVLPALHALKTSPNETVGLVNHTAVEEVLQDLGTLDFGKGVEAKANAAVWRTRGDEKPLVGEFSFQCKFQRRNDLHDKAMKRCDQFFCALQHSAADWVALGTTKTGAVYRLKGNPPQSHE